MVLLISKNCDQETRISFVDSHILGQIGYSVFYADNSVICIMWLVKHEDYFSSIFGSNQGL